MESRESPKFFHYGFNEKGQSHIVSTQGGYYNFKLTTSHDRPRTQLRPQSQPPIEQPTRRKELQVLPEHECIGKIDPSWFNRNSLFHPPQNRLPPKEETQPMIQGRSEMEANNARLEALKTENARLKALLAERDEIITVMKRTDAKKL